MKKIAIMALGLLLTLSATAGTKDGDGQVRRAQREAVERVRQAPRGTTYGVTAVTRDHIVITSPFGRHTIARNGDTYSCLGLTARVASVRGSVYHVQTSIGNFAVDIRRMTVTKE